MTHPFEKEILTSWKALSEINDRIGWVSIPNYICSNWSISSAYNIDSHEHAIFFEINSAKNHFGQLKFPAAQGFKIQQIRVEDSKSGLAIIRKVDGDLDLFIKMAVDVCNIIMQNKNLTESNLSLSIVNRINAWLSFMRKGLETLSLEAEIGLIGELEIISRLIKTHIPIQDILDAWVGPLDGMKDFELGIGAIEIKSTLSSDGFIANIGSLEQLDDSQISPLFVCGCRFSLHNTGLTLVERINLLRKQLIGFPSELSQLNNLLLRVGYLESAAEDYTRQFKTENTYFWLVDKNFPRLVPGNIAVNIRQAKYEIDLTSLMNDSISLSIVLEKLGIGNSGIN